MVRAARLAVACVLVALLAYLAIACSKDRCGEGRDPLGDKDKSVDVSGDIACDMAKLSNVQIGHTSADYRSTGPCKMACGSGYAGCALPYDYADSYLEVNGAYDGGNTVDPTHAVCPPVPSNKVSVDCSECEGH
jgi:hypothetical protein